MHEHAGGWLVSPRRNGGHDAPSGTSLESTPDSCPVSGIDQHRDPGRDEELRSDATTALRREPGRELAVAIVALRDRDRAGSQCDAESFCRGAAEAARREQIDQAGTGEFEELSAETEDVHGERTGKALRQRF